MACKTLLQPISNELQIDGVLNNLVQQSHRADFAMVLAMMSGNVLDQAQFQLTDKPAMALNEEVDSIYQELEVPKPASLVALAEDGERNKAINVALRDGGVASMKLNHYLTPEAITLKDDLLQIDEEVLFNSSPHALSKAQANNNQVLQQQPLSTNETQLFEWLEQFDDSKPIKAISYNQ